MTTETTDATTIEMITANKLKAAAPTVSMTKECHETCLPTNPSLLIFSIVIFVVVILFTSPTRVLIDIAYVVVCVVLLLLWIIGLFVGTKKRINKIYR